MLEEVFYKTGERTCSGKAKARRDAIARVRPRELHLPEQTASLQSLQERVKKDGDGNGSWCGLWVYRLSGLS